MPNMIDGLRLRPQGPNGTTQYTTGFDVVTSAGPSDGVPVVTVQAIARPSAWLLGPGLAAVLAQLNTYYGAGKAAQVLAAAGIPAAYVSGSPAAPVPGVPLVVVNSDSVTWQVLPADVTAQASAMVTLLGTGGNVSKGGNP